jgi:Family of unknown function (DUF6308)
MPLAVLPRSLTRHSDAHAIQQLRDYYAPAPEHRGGIVHTGSLFDTWAGGGDGAAVADRFTADDLVAASLVGVTVPGRTAILLLDRQAEKYHKLLEAIGPDRDLVEVGDGEINPQWPAWRAHDRMRTLDGLDWVGAARLLARKRPRLLPAYDRVVRAVLGGEHYYWEPLRESLRADGGALHSRLLRIRDQADVPALISAIRVFDIIAWMDAQGALPR